MRDDCLPIMRIFMAFFLIEADYVTMLLNPYLLDFERGWILCIAALWNTFKPACTAAKHRSVNFLLPAHPHPDDIAHRRIQARRMGSTRRFKQGMSGMEYTPHKGDSTLAAQAGFQADFTYSMSTNVITITNPDLGNTSVTNDIESVLRKIEYWHQGSIATFRIMYRDSLGVWDGVHWDGQRAPFLPLKKRTKL